MIFHFATCERWRALHFLQTVYPSKTVTDTPGCAGPILDLVEKDLIRVQDPMMHSVSGRIQIIPGTHFSEAMRQSITDVCREFAERVA